MFLLPRAKMASSGGGGDRVSTLSPSEMKTDQKLKTWCAEGVCVRVRVPVAFRNKCERVTGPQPERVRSIFAGVNATRTSGMGPERDRNANWNKCEHGLSHY